jgi:hypothetical protein
VAGAALASLTLVAAGCGGSSGAKVAQVPNGGTPTAAQQANTQQALLKYAQCMRSHGVPKFPDPKPGGGLIIGPKVGVDPNTRQFKAAQQTCQKLVPGAPISRCSRRQDTDTVSMTPTSKARRVRLALGIVMFVVAGVALSLLAAGCGGSSQRESRAGRHKQRRERLGVLERLGLG